MYAGLKQVMVRAASLVLLAVDGKRQAWRLRHCVKYKLSHVQVIMNLNCHIIYQDGAIYELLLLDNAALNWSGCLGMNAGSMDVATVYVFGR